MALTGTTDITFNDNLKDNLSILPIELKQHIMSFISIRKFVSYNDTSVHPFVDTYIKNYINARLFTDAKTFTFLRLTQWYGDLIDDKMNAMATNWAKDFMAQCQLLNNKPDAEKSNWGVFFRVKYNRSSTDRAGNIDDTPKISALRSHRNGVAMICDLSIRGTNMKEECIIDEIITSICHFMNNYKGIYQIKSIELAKSFYNTGGSPFDFSDVFDSPNSTITVLKKYY